MFAVALIVCACVRACACVCIGSLFCNADLSVLSIIFFSHLADEERERESCWLI